MIDSSREQIQDAVAVYFVRPTRENIDKICQDCQAQLYSSFYFNFISPISRSLLEDLARAAVTANCVDQIAKVGEQSGSTCSFCKNYFLFFPSQLYDQYLNFVSLEEDFFITRQLNTKELSYYGKKKRERKRVRERGGRENFMGFFSFSLQQ